MVAVLHPAIAKATTTGRTSAVRSVASTLISTTLDTSQPAGTVPFALVLNGGNVYARFEDSTNNFLAVSIPGDYLGTRPVILAFTTGPRRGTNLRSTEPPVGRLSLLANKLTTAGGTHQRLATNSRLWLGRDDDVTEHVTRMEVLDIAVGEALSAKKEVALISALDGAYGVSGA
jgi:hypothetical protein